MKANIKIGQSNFLIQVGYHERINKFFNSVPGVTYSLIDQAFSCPLKEKDNVVNFLVGLNISVHEVEQFKEKKENKEVLYQLEEEKIYVFFPYNPKVIFF
jgi:hypothetical protein